MSLKKLAEEFAGGDDNMTIQRIETVAYGVTDLETCIAFLENWGLEKVHVNDAGAEFRTLENQRISLRQADDPSLPATGEDGSTVREIVWGVKDKAGVAAIGDELSSDREVREDQDGSLHSYDDSGFAIGFRVADITPVDTPDRTLNIHGKVERVNERSWPEDRMTPLRIGHAVYSIEQEGNWKAAEFYLNRLNFRLTDRSEGGGTFMRCEGSTFHHSLFLFHRVGTQRYFNHLAFEVNSFDDIMMGGTHMLKNGAVSVSGPGRHSLGSNWFWYFNNPCGGDIEYFADMDRMDDDWEPRYWDESPPFARWMLGDGILTG